MEKAGRACCKSQVKAESPTVDGIQTIDSLGVGTAFKSAPQSGGVRCEPPAIRDWLAQMLLLDS